MHLFINYAHSDKDQVEQMVNLLRENGHHVWFEKLLPKQDWTADLLAAITACHAMIYALSPDSVGVEWCQWEVAQAVRLGKPIIPLVVRTPVNIPPMLTGLSWVDISEGVDENTVLPLLTDLTNMKDFITSPDSAHEFPEHPHGIPAQAMGTIVPPGMRGGGPQATEE